MSAETRPAVLEIIFERGKAPENESLAMPVPTEVRINGVPLWTPDDTPIQIERIEAGGDDLVLATITLICRKVSIGFEDDFHA